VRAVLNRIGWLNRGWARTVDDVSAFYQALPEPTLRHLLNALYQKKVAEHGAVRWGDKTPTYVRYIAELNDIFPTAQFVHLIRDGRDAALSAEKKWGHRRWYMDDCYLLKSWVRNVEGGRKAGESLELNRYLEIQYEALVQRPERIVRRLCIFLREEFHPAMLDHTGLAREQIGPQGHVEVRSPISTASVQRWKKEMSPFARKMANRIAGPTLTATGYPLADIPPLSPSEGLRLLSLWAKYRVTSAPREILPKLGIPTLNRDKRKPGLRSAVRGMLSVDL
jgi:hypothetical protein